MAKVKNYHVHGTPETINRLKEEYEFLGRIVKVVSPNHIMILALPPAKPKKVKNARSKHGDSRDNSESGRVHKRTY